MNIPTETVAKDVVSLAERLNTPPAEQGAFLNRDRVTDALMTMLTSASATPIPSYERDFERAELVRAIRSGAPVVVDPAN